MFNEVGVNRIETEYNKGNPKSGRVMKKRGLKYRGTMYHAAKNKQEIFLYFFMYRKVSPVFFSIILYPV